jgi:protein tyrosine phosphatase (PTP) superfamily phosphohydrolase (DUF442 family)
MWSRSLTVLGAGCVLAAGGLFGLAETDEPGAPQSKSARSAAQQPAPRPEPVSSPNIENLFRVAPKLYSGGEPRGEAAFAELKKLGVRTIISVDGAAPEVEAARKQGIRYVHLPFGYDGVPTERAVQLARAATELPGPVFVHCHHGKHRGPAAAAVCGMAAAGWTSEQAVAWMKLAGTDSQYRGLYESVKSFRLPSADELSKIPAEFPERARVSSLVEVMVRVDARWDRLKAARDAGWPDKSKNSRKLSATQEALQLAELFRELARSETELPKDEEFRKFLRESVVAAEGLHGALAALEQQPSEGRLQQRDREFTALGRLCKSCHQQFRDAP